MGVQQLSLTCHQRVPLILPFVLADWLKPWITRLQRRETSADQTQKDLESCAAD